MQCPACNGEMEYESGLESNGLCVPMIPSATYICNDCGNQYQWMRLKGLIPDEDNREYYKGLFD